MSQDQKFFDIYSVVVGGLMLFSFFILVFALNLGGGLQSEFVKDSDEYKAAIAERISPVGTVMRPGEAEKAAAAAAAAAEAEAAVALVRPGREIYSLNCTACHSAGVAGAPVTGDVEGWAPRIAKGMETLKDHAINGFQGEAGYMPAMGGDSSLKEEEVANAVEFMVAESS